MSTCVSCDSFKIDSKVQYVGLSHMRIIYGNRRVNSVLSNMEIVSLNTAQFLSAILTVRSDSLREEVLTFFFFP